MMLYAIVISTSFVHSLTFVRPNLTCRRTALYSWSNMKGEKRLPSERADFLPPADSITESGDDIDADVANQYEIETTSNFNGRVMNDFKKLKDQQESDFLAIASSMFLDDSSPSTTNDNNNNNDSIAPFSQFIDSNELIVDDIDVAVPLSQEEILLREQLETLAREDELARDDEFSITDFDQME